MLRKGWLSVKFCAINRPMAGRCNVLTNCFNWYFQNWISKGYSACNTTTKTFSGKISQLQIFQIWNDIKAYHYQFHSNYLILMINSTNFNFAMSLRPKNERSWFNSMRPQAFSHHRPERINPYIKIFLQQWRIRHWIK